MFITFRVKIPDIEENIWISVTINSITLLKAKGKEPIHAFRLETIDIAYYPYAIIINPNTLNLRIAVENSCSIEKLIKFYQSNLGMKIY